MSQGKLFLRPRNVIISAIILLVVPIIPVLPVHSSSPSTSQGPLAINLINNFDGLAQAQGPGGGIPPDPIIAAGPNYLVEMVNSFVGIYSKSGSLVSLIDNCTFFGVSSGCATTDPQVIYDSGSGRFFASALKYDFTRGAYDGVYFAVSTSSDPTGSWNKYSNTLSVGTDSFDFDKIGVSDDKFVVSVSSASYNEEYWVISKKDVMSGTTNPTYKLFTDTALLFDSLAPVQSQGTKTLYMVGIPAPWDSKSYVVIAVNGEPHRTVTATKTTITLANSVTPSMEAPQAGTSILNEVLGGIPMSPIWDQVAELWFATVEGCIPPNENSMRDCLRLIQINTDRMTVTQDFDYGVAGEYLFFPAIRTDAQHNLIVVFGWSSSSEYPSLGIIGQGSASMPGTYSPRQYLWLGDAPNTNSFRFGDYFGASMDGNNVWVVGEYISSHTAPNWSTRIGQAHVYGVDGYVTPTGVTHAYSNGQPSHQTASASLYLSGVGQFSGTVYAYLTLYYSNMSQGPNLTFTSSGTNAGTFTIPADGSAVLVNISIRTCHQTIPGTYTFYVLVNTPSYSFSGRMGTITVTVTGTDSNPPSC